MEAMPLIAALVAGLTGSLHCAVMCGPLACVGGAGTLAPAVGWQAGRLGAYVGLGALLGAGSGAVLNGCAEVVRPCFPYLMAAGLAFTALDLGRHWKAPRPLAQISRWLASLGAKFSPTARGLTLGMATPFLPCGLVWGMALAATATGSATDGAQLLGAFALGSIPALGLAQAQAKLWPTTGRFAGFARRAVVLLAAAVIVWRALSVDPVSASATCH